MPSSGKLRSCQGISRQVLFHKISVLLQRFNKPLPRFQCLYDTSSGEDSSDSDLQPVRRSFTVDVSA
jgi:hypothetical protein